MKTTRKAIPGEENYQQPGYFVADGIITYRCDNCFQHMSLFEYAISKTGMVTPDVVCPNCKTIHVQVRLTGLDPTMRKVKKEVRIKK